MKRSEASDVLITGVGVTAAIGQGRDAFVEALLQGAHRFDVLSRPGRQLPSAAEAVGGIAPPPFIGAELPALAMPARVPRSMLRTASLSGQAALATLDEAWTDAALDEAEPTRIGLIVGGSNLQQRESALATEPYRGRETFLRPNYGLSFMDSDLCGMCTEVFGIRAFAFTVGGASASGQVAAIHAMEAVRSGRVDICIAIGALMDVSYWELQGLRSLGAMGSDRYAGTPAAACRPFDSGRDGFIYGESCAALVFERADTAALRRGVSPYARAAGWAMAMDGNRNPNPALEGEASAIRGALSMAQTAADRIDYVNPHGTGSHIGDITELQALSDCGLRHARIHATKSVIGHGLTAAGAVELAAVVLQMRAGRLHPSRNLDDPFEPEFAWVRGEAQTHRIERALNMSMGFGGVNTAVCLHRC